MKKSHREIPPRGSFQPTKEDFIYKLPIWAVTKADLAGKSVDRIRRTNKYWYSAGTYWYFRNYWHAYAYWQRRQKKQ